jgi:hypothetical protein
MVSGLTAKSGSIIARKAESEILEFASPVALKDAKSGIMRKGCLRACSPTPGEFHR